MVWDIKDPSSVFCIWISSCFSTSCWKDYHFSTGLSLYLCQKSVVYISVGLFLDSVPLICLPYLYACTTLFYYNLKWGSFSPLAIFVFKVVLGNLGSLHFQINSRISFSISLKKKKHVGILIGTTLNLFGGRADILTVQERYKLTN